MYLLTAVQAQSLKPVRQAMQEISEEDEVKALEEFKYLRMQLAAMMDAQRNSQD